MAFCWSLLSQHDHTTAAPRRWSRKNWDHRRGSLETLHLVNNVSKKCQKWANRILFFISSDKCIRYSSRWTQADWWNTATIDETSQNNPSASRLHIARCNVMWRCFTNSQTFAWSSSESNVSYTLAGMRQNCVLDTSAAYSENPHTNAKLRVSLARMVLLPRCRSQWSVDVKPPAPLGQNNRTAPCWAGGPGVFTFA